MPRRSNKKKVIKEEITPLNLSEKIKKASQGLYYISEIDAEILPFEGTKTDTVSPEEILRQTNNKSDAPIEERNFDEIFQRLTTIKDWFGNEEKLIAEKYAELRDLLTASLKDLKVFKIGKIQIDIYFVGLDSEGNLTGIQTKAVET